MRQKTYHFAPFFTLNFKYVLIFSKILDGFVRQTQLAIIDFWSLILGASLANFYNSNFVYGNACFVYIIFPTSIPKFTFRGNSSISFCQSRGHLSFSKKDPNTILGSGRVYQSYISFIGLQAK